MLVSTQEEEIRRKVREKMQKEKEERDKTDAQREAETVGRADDQRGDISRSHLSISSRSRSGG